MKADDVINAAIGWVIKIAFWLYVAYIAVMVVLELSVWHLIAGVAVTVGGWVLFGAMYAHHHKQD